MAYVDKDYVKFYFLLNSSRYDSLYFNSSRQLIAL